MITTAQRLIDLLQIVPRRAPGATASELGASLASRGWKMHLRTLQRDLQDLSARYPLVSSGKPLRWHWSPTAKAVQMPGLDVTGATIWTLIELHLRPLLPPSLLDELKPQFVAASEVLKLNSGGRAAWAKRIARISSGYPLAPPHINADVYRTVADCVALRRCFKATYCGRYEPMPKSLEVNPLGLVVRDQTIYLVASLWDYEKPLQLALHRFRAIEQLDRPARDLPGFDLQTYARSAFGYPVGSSIKIKMRFSEEAGFHLTEASLAEDQRVERLKDGTYEVAATVEDTMQLRWWLLAFGDQVEVLKPVKLRREIAAHAESMAKMYATG